MSLPLQRVTPGQKLEVPARDWNAFVDAARWVQQQQRALGGGPFGAPTPNPVIVKVKNVSGADIPAGAVLGIDEPIFPPPGDTLSANTLLQIDLRGITPTEEHEGAFVVTLAPLRKNAVGRAVIGGVCWVKVGNGGGEAEDEEDTTLTRAEVSSGSTAKLVANSDGSAQILWRQPGQGDKWAIVRLGNTGAGGSRAKQFKVTTGGLTSVSAKEWDGTTLGDGIFDITTVMGHAVDDIIYAVEIDNVILDPDVPTEKMWLELLKIDPSADLYKVMQVKDIVGRLGLDYVRAHS